MTKSQFNIKISKDLLIKVKRQAMMSGKSLTEHITDLVTKSLHDNDIFDENIFIYKHIMNVNLINIIIKKKMNLLKQDQLICALKRFKEN